MEIRFDTVDHEQFNVFLVTQLAPDSFVEDYAGLDYVVIPPNSVSEIHRHNHSDNLIFIIDGEAELVLDGKLHSIHPKLRVIIPKTVSHGFRTGAQTLRFISIQIPPILNKKLGIFDREVIG